MKDEKGFIMPSMMVIVFFCLLITAHISMSLVNEKKFYEETKQYYTLDSIMQVAVEKSLKEVKSGSALLNEQISVNTYNGQLTYLVQEVSPLIFNVSITCQTNEGKEYTASYQYDSAKNEMNVWSEY
ncbi:competence type IV pilus minor pilin ComGG [Metabacillus litoralis]|uniref:competence type IV pilus minor pilin ComGG n=1 Tax=Metabacillus litoralis TaxID=152268 RepID=UPI00203EFA74|nr:competence type IV pilus minor pilin ComGG [Metabacillus litoralis]MCM3161757.1 ComGG family competence protein [Metabacillus litoralis]